MSFHRTVMRNRARRIMGNAGLHAAWPAVRAANWQARGCLAVVWTSRHKSRGAYHEAPAVVPRVTRAHPRGANILKRFIRDIADTANSMAFLRARAQAR